MNCLVLGAAGFIGRHLCRGLLSDGFAVRGFDLYPNIGQWPDIKGVEWMAGDFANEHDIEHALKGADLVFHLISATIPKTSNEDPVLDLKKNVGGTLGLLNAIAKMPMKPRIFFSSSGGTVYGVPKTVPISENHPTDPICAYGVGKLAIEKYLELYRKLYGIEYCILRISNPYGIHQSVHTGQGVIPTFIWKVLNGNELEIWGDGSVIRDYIHIEDVITAFRAAVNYRGQNRIFNIGSSIGISLIEIINLIENVFGKKSKCRYMDGRPCDVPINILSIDRAKNELSWKPMTPLREGIETLISYYKHSYFKDSILPSEAVIMKSGHMRN